MCQKSPEVFVSCSFLRGPIVLERFVHAWNHVQPLLINFNWSLLRLILNLAHTTVVLQERYDVIT